MVRECMCTNLVQCIADSFVRIVTMELGFINFLTVALTKGSGSIIKCMVKECLWIRRVIVGRVNSLKASINPKCRSSSKWKRCWTKRKLTYVRMLHTSSQNSWMHMLIQIKKQWRITCYPSLQQLRTSNCMSRNLIHNLQIVYLRSGKLESSSWVRVLWKYCDRIVQLKCWIHKIFWHNNSVVWVKWLKYRCKRMHDWWD